MRKSSTIPNPPGKALSGHLLAVVASLACASCLVIPLSPFTESAFRPEVMQKLSQQGVDRNQVRQILGEPQWVKANGEFWFYTTSRATWGIMGGSSGTVIEEHRWLAVQFDQAGHLVFAGQAKWSDCLSNGLCFDGSAPPERALPARSYRPKADECGVYLYLNPLPWPLPAGSVKYAVDGKAVGVVNSGNFLFLTHPAGDISITAYDLKISTHCVGGEKLYVRAVKKKDWSWETGEDLAPVGAAEGEAAIGARKLALPD